MTITIKSNSDGVSGAIQVNGVDKVTIGSSGITAGSFAPNSIDAAAAALAFSGANQSLASSGYQKLPSGLIIQWGSVTTTTPAAGTLLGTAVTFPITFPSACLQAFGCLGSIPNYTYAGVSAEGLGLSSFNLVFCSGVGSGYYMLLHWMAVGK